LLRDGERGGESLQIKDCGQRSVMFWFAVRGDFKDFLGMKKDKLFKIKQSKKVKYILQAGLLPVQKTTIQEGGLYPSHDADVVDFPINYFNLRPLYTLICASLTSRPGGQQGIPYRCNRKWSRCCVFWGKTVLARAKTLRISIMKELLWGSTMHMSGRQGICNREHSH